MQNAAPDASLRTHPDPDPDSAFFQRADPSALPPASTSASASTATSLDTDAYVLTLPPDAGAHRLDKQPRAMNVRPEMELGPPFTGDVRTAHLPTPQSPSTFQPYMNGASASPLPQRLTASQPQPQPVASTSRAQMITPDSSPLAARRWMSGPGAGDTTPTKRRRMSPKTPPPTAGPALTIKTESPTSSQHRKSPSPPLQPLQQTPTQSRLSSPFAPTPVAASRAHSPPATPPHPQSPSPAHPTPSTSTSTTSAPIPDTNADADPSDTTRPAGGELTRIRASQARARAEAELRRPDYLKRVPSFAPAPSTSTTGAGVASTSTTGAGVGVTESPAKGRRIALWGFAETSEESFEERLMAGGYGGYGSTGGELVAGVGAGVGIGAVGKDEGRDEDGGQGAGAVLDAREATKRRRLDAFRSAPRAEAPGLLRPVEVEGKGRVLVDVSRAETEALVEAAAPRRRGGRRRGAGRGKGKAREEVGRREAEERARVRAADAGEGVLDWPDREFPWCVRTMERKEQEQAEEEEKLRWIERFLEEESAESDEEGEGEDAVAPMEGVQPPPGPAAWFRGGRGKTVPLHEHNAPAGRVAFPSDPADARAALLSKREVRALAYRRQLAMDLDPGPEPADDEIVCVCRGRDDGRELVQCDSCRTWYHLECIGIHDVAELGREEDPWYCPRCVDGDGEEDAPSSEPTFAPTDEGPTPHRPHPDPLFFQAIASQESPSDAWRGRFPDMPTTPTRGSGARASNISLARSSWTDGSTAHHDHDHPATPPSHAPPTHVRVQATTPGYERNFMPEGGSPFDPTSTPSRGFLFGAPFATPKPGLAPRGAGTGMSTPPARHALPSGSPYRGRGGVYDDTPVDRTGPRPVAALPARKVLDSPLMGRGHVRYGAPGLAESPVIRGKGKAKERVGR